MKLKLTYERGELTLYPQGQFYKGKEKLTGVELNEFLKGLSPNFKDYTKGLMDYTTKSMKKMQKSNKNATPKLEMEVVITMDGCL